jgi:hypothetical protein
MGEGLMNGDVLSKCAIDRRRCEKTHAWAKIVATRKTLWTRHIWYARLNRHAFANPTFADTVPDSYDDTRSLVAQDKWRLHHEIPYAAVLVVMSIRTTHTHCPDLHKDLSVRRFGHRAILQDDVPRTPQNNCSHRVTSNLSWCDPI